jgi:hypothetical protein
MARIEAPESPGPLTRLVWGIAQAADGREARRAGSR